MRTTRELQGGNTAKVPVNTLQEQILERVKEVIPAAHEAMRAGVKNVDGKQVPPEVKTSLAMDNGVEIFQIIVNGASFFSDDRQLIRLEKERQARVRELGAGQASLNTEK